MNLKGQPASVGRYCGGNRYHVTKELVEFYAEALDDHSPLYDRYAPPLVYHSECYRFLGDWYLQNLFGNLHGQQDWELFAPIEVGQDVQTRSTIIDRYDKRGRNYVVNETDVMAADDGRLLVRGRTHQSFLPPKEEPQTPEDAAQRGEDAFVVDEQTASKKSPRPAFPTATGPDLQRSSKTIDERRCWMFSGPGKNYHTDAEEARKLGFPHIVVQGMMSTCFVSQVMQDHFGMGWLAGGKMSVKLINVIWADDRVTAHARVREEHREGSRQRVHCDVWVDKADGTRALLGTASALSDS